ncbi:GNAT family N-acetyltransferase [Cellulomonas sp. C5510]|uniref:GNAT family N-acetyltransferase n=1 Tax=Cellulomonas sp. C5510 TaxID=2871170 RepID=UPI001C985790|nr:GNAT family N-acetyltransferase [Cellulomonas sp. C5510]QZN85344.1 GNAT family N-acetyltransferase [Cellulomonas sp. C5510]
MPLLLDHARRALDAVPLNVGFARAALDVAGVTPWADRERDPRAFHVAHPYGMSLVWGAAAGEVRDAVAAHLAARRAAGHEEWLQIDPRWTTPAWDDVLGAVPLEVAGDRPAPGSVVRHTRVNFACDPAAHRARLGALRPPEGWRTRRATEADFARSGAVVPSGFWPDAASFLAHGGGTVVERDGRVGAIAFTSYRTGDDLELGIETDPAFRRQGLASAAAAAMLADVLDAGLTPVWSCREDNVGSARLAQRLGFTPSSRTPYYHLLPW